MIRKLQKYAEKQGKSISMTHHLTYEPIHSYDIPNLQAMTQGTAFGGLEFNRAANATLIARHNGQMVGFIAGHKEYGQDFNALRIIGSYLYTQFRDPLHQQDMQLALINWAKDKLGVTHYFLPQSSTPHLIGIENIIPPMPIENKGSQTPTPSIHSQEFVYS